MNLREDVYNTVHTEVYNKSLDLREDVVYITETGILAELNSKGFFPILELRNHIRAVVRVEARKTSNKK